jgi:chromosome segregation ATPase
MISKVRFPRSLLVAALVALTLGSVSAVSAQDPDGRPKAGDAAPASETVKAQATAADPVKALSDQVRELSAEIRNLRRTIERNDQRIELLLSEEKLARVEDGIAVSQQRAADLDAADQTLQYRENHVNDEVVLRGGLDREATEEAVRADIQQRSQEVEAGRAANQKRMSSLEAEASRLRNHIADLHRALNPDADKGDLQK